ncbi:MAG: chemotaxis-specific protein-glutamate methyltransferase CheB [Chloroflexota bacterium]
MTPTTTHSKTRVLVVDDSRVAREYLTHILEEDPRIEVLDAVATGEAAVEYVGRRKPDIILMDLHLPGIDGFEATRQIMAGAPVPIIVCTAGTSFHEVKTAMEALSAGALAALRKPIGPMHPNADADTAALVSMLRLMAQVKVVRRWRRPTPAAVPPPQVVLPAAPPRGIGVVAIGASTGGPPALAAILRPLPEDFGAPVLVVQHITEGFSEGFCTWLSGEIRRPVHVARTGDQPVPGHVYVAGDGGHLRVVGAAGRLEVSPDGPPTVHRPSIDVLFASVAKVYGRRAIGVLLTGMGKDGAQQLRTLAEAGAMTIAQDEASSVVFGMPGEAIRLGAAQAVLPPAAIGDLLRRMVGIKGSGS